jgi:hypothetical protein
MFPRRLGVLIPWIEDKLVEWLRQQHLSQPSRVKAHTACMLRCHALWTTVSG